jgi:hypothetical protein
MTTQMRRILNVPICRWNRPRRRAPAIYASVLRIVRVSIDAPFPRIELTGLWWGVARTGDRRLLHELTFYQNLRRPTPHPIGCFNQSNSQRVGLFRYDFKPSGAPTVLGTEALGDVLGVNLFVIEHELTVGVAASVPFQPKKARAW